MKIIKVQPGSPEWHAFRACHRQASVAAAVMGEHKYMSRQEALRQYASGVAKEVDENTQRLFDKGHEAEAKARQIAELQLGEPLFPTVGESSQDARYGASFDGMNMLGTVIWEHKLANQKLVDQVLTGELEPHYYWQLEHQLYVSGADEAIFACSNGTEESYVSMVYRPVDGRLSRLLAAWDQFENDAEDYQQVIPADIPKGAEVSADLPALVIEVRGQVVQANIDDYKTQALAWIETINTDLVTDQDFADAESMVKFCDKAEKELKAAKTAALKQMADVNTLFAALDAVIEAMSKKRLKLDKDVKSQKQSRKDAIITKAKQDLAAHYAELNKALGGNFMQVQMADFAGAMHGKKSLQTAADAVADCLANAKTAASVRMQEVQINVQLIQKQDNPHLFPDLADLANRPYSDLVQIIETRNMRHQLEQEKAEQAKQQETTQATATAPVQTEAPKKAPTGGAILKPARPSDYAIVDLVASHWGVAHGEAIRWIKEMDFSEMESAA
jgi:putative phage-type endonuclease